MQETIGWVGLGKMGLPMAQRLLQAGYRLHVWARNPEQTLSLRKQGARVATDLIELAQRSGIVFTMLGDTHDVESVYEGLLAGVQPNTIFIDMTTAAPRISAVVAKRLATRDAAFLDAPVTGGVTAATDGSLIHFVGGDADVLQRVESILAHLGKRTVYCGEQGAGYRMKLVNQTIVAGMFFGLADGISLARSSHFDLELLASALDQGTASSALFHSYLKRMMEGGGDVTYTLGLLRKDLRLAQAEAELQQKPSLFLKFALDHLNAACQRFGAHAGVQKLSRL
jgi:3-hydroxyisobutyrate dehydrogenase-like beta-hydroxyacid dehydrogenase